uniref:Beta/gamma crystallin 'Greek key' domain-containing protein n=1 Tax=Callorhinchus milii TaxID=7868 RepID=A0A4W3INX0_CALMI
ALFGRECNTHHTILFFQGHHYECSSDCDDLQSFFKSCNSNHIESGFWVIYEKPSYLGYQYILTKGEYSKYHDWGAFNATVGAFKRITEF